MRIKHIEIRNFRGIKSLSWFVKSDFNCIIGPGDTCKTTILTALDYALSPRTSLAFDDSDFFDQDVSHSIIIQVTLGDWDENLPDIRAFFQESKFAQYKCGISGAGPIYEPQADNEIAVSISLRVDESLEPKWSVVKGRDEDEDQDRKSIYAKDRAVLGISRVDISSDTHFSWGRNTILTRLSTDNHANLNGVLSSLSREMKQRDIAHHDGIQQCQTVADSISQEAQKIGVKLAGLLPRIDIQRQSMGSGAFALHEDNVPLRNKGSGSKKLVAAAMQMKLHDGKNISLIDEIEVGLEPHRIRGLIYKLKKSEQQIFTTTHSPVVLRELNVAGDELYVCSRDRQGNVCLESLNTVPDIQGPIRSNAEAFLGSKIVACEGATEIGCLRAYDISRFDGNSPPVWSLATSYFNCGGAGYIKTICPKLIQLGYQAAVLCDNDAPDQISDDDVKRLRNLGAHVCQWDDKNSTEQQLFLDIPWRHIAELLEKIAGHHDSLELQSIIDSIVKEPQIVGKNIGNDPTKWIDTPLLRQVIGELANKGKWIKRTDYSQRTFQFAFPLLPDTSVIKSKLGMLWTWIQNNE